MNILDNSRVNEYPNYNSIIFILALPFSQLVRDIFIIEILGIYVTTYKVTLLFGSMLMLKYVVPLVSGRYMWASPAMFLYQMFLVLQLFSIFLSNHLSMSQRMNYTFLNLAIIVIILGLSWELSQIQPQIIVKKLNTALELVFWLSIVMGTAQLILRNPIINGMGIIPDNLSYYITGFNYERLFLSEFLTLGITSISVSKNKYTGKILFILMGWTFLLILLSNSYTGLIGLVGALIISSRRYARRVLILLPLSIMISFLSSYIVTDTELLNREEKTKRYIENYDVSNWRYISSISLIREFIRKPTIFGNGYKSNEVHLAPLFDKYYYRKHNRYLSEHKNNSSHTLISILFDQGAIGMITFISFLVLAVKTILWLLTIKKRVFTANTENALIILTSVFMWLMIMRYLFYYHTLQHWFYIIAIVLLNVSYFYFHFQYPRASSHR